MRFFLLSIGFWLMFDSLSAQSNSAVAFKMKAGPEKFVVVEAVKWQDIYLGLSRSEKYVGYGKAPSQLEEIRLDTIFWQHIFSEENKRLITNHVVAPDWDNIHRRIVSVEIRDSVLLAHGLFVIDRIFENYKDPHMLAMTIYYDLKSKTSGLQVHHLSQMERLTGYRYLFHSYGEDDKLTLNFHVSYWNNTDSASFVINQSGPFVPNDSRLRYTNSLTTENRLVYSPPKWAINYKIGNDSTVDLYNNGYEIVDVNSARIVYRSDSLYGLCSPLFLYRGKVCVLAQLLNHQTIMTEFKVLDQKIVSITDGEYLPLPEGFKWYNQFVLPKGKGIPISNELEALSYENEVSKLLKVRF
jgi:hypothetical protein